MARSAQVREHDYPDPLGSHRGVETSKAAARKVAGLGRRIEAAILWRLRRGPMSDEQINSYVRRLGRDFPERERFNGFAGAHERATQPARSRLKALGMVAPATGTDGATLKVRNARGNLVNMWVAT